MVTDALWSFKSIFQEGETCIKEYTPENSEGKKVQIVTKINDIFLEWLWYQLKFLISDIWIYTYIFPHFLTTVEYPILDYSSSGFILLIHL